MFFFFSIPMWVILAIIIFGVGSLGLSIAWIAEHLLIISIILWGLLLIVGLFMSEKGKKVHTLSLLCLCIPLYIAFAKSFIAIAELVDHGHLIKMLFSIVDAVVLIVGTFIITLLLIGKECEYIDDHDGKKCRRLFTLLNFLLSPILSGIVLWLCSWGI